MMLARMADGLWVLSSYFPTPTNVWLVDRSEGLTAVDCGLPWWGPRMLDAASRIGLPLRRVILTHAHPDHAGAAAYLASHGVEMCAHRDDVPYLRGEASMADLPGGWICRCILRVGRSIGWLDVRTVRSVVPVDDGDIVDGMRVLHTPGHTPGSLSLWDPTDGALYCGDNLATTYGWMRLGNFMFTLDARARDRSLKRCLDLPARVLLPGHGPRWVGDVPEAIARRLRGRP